MNSQTDPDPDVDRALADLKQAWEMEEKRVGMEWMSLGFGVAAELLILAGRASRSRRLVWPDKTGPRTAFVLVVREQVRNLDRDRTAIVLSEFGNWLATKATKALVDEVSKHLPETAKV